MSRENVADVDLGVVRRGFDLDELFRLGSDEFGDTGLMGIANYERDAGELGDLFRGTLRVTACDEDLRRGVLAVHAADGLADVVIGIGGDGAGVEDYPVGCMVRFRPGHACRGERGLDSRAVRL